MAKQKKPEVSERTMIVEGVPIRVVRYNGKTYIPVVDIATGIGYDRSNLLRLIYARDDLFKDSREYLPLSTKGGTQSTLCVPRDKIVAMFMGLKINMIQDTPKRSVVIGFRKWAFDTFLEEEMDKRKEKPPKKHVEAFPRVKLPDNNNGAMVV